ncbi:MAG TPA: TolC family protein [Hanamia sp.]
MEYKQSLIEYKEEYQMKYKSSLLKASKVPSLGGDLGEAMKSLFLIVLLVSFTIITSAQKKLTLKDAIEIGISKNLDVLQSGLQMEQAAIALNQSRENKLPDLNAVANQGINFGRSIDPYTNGYIDQSVGYVNYGASTNVLLFNGFSLQNAVKSNKLGYDASRLELQQAKDNLTIKIILAYLQVLNADEILDQSRDFAQVTQEQVNRLGVLNNSGSILPSDYYDLKGQLASDQITIVENKASLETAKVSLSQLLNIPYDKNLELEKIADSSLNNNYTDEPDQIYATALQQFAEVTATELRTKSAKKNIRAVKGQLFPTLSFNGNINTNYSSAANRDFYVNTTDVTSSNYVTVDGANYPVIQKQDNYNSQKIMFGSQVNNNLYYTLNIGLTVPLFNAHRIRNQVKLATLGYKNNQLIEQSTKTQLQQNIEQAYVNLNSSRDKYKLLQDQVNAFKESFRTAEIRFNAGAITSVDYLIVKNNFNRAQSNLTTAKYDFVLRGKVLDYYGGKPLW